MHRLDRRDLDLGVELPSARERARDGAKALDASPRLRGITVGKAPRLEHACRRALVGAARGVARDRTGIPGASTRCIERRGGVPSAMSASRILRIGTFTSVALSADATRCANAADGRPVTSSKSCASRSIARRVGSPVTFFSAVSMPRLTSRAPVPS
jgi:hypothetical protein